MPSYYTRVVTGVQRRAGNRPSPPFPSALIMAGVNDFKVAVCDNLRFMGDIPDGSVQLVVTSPPYNLGKEYEDPMGIDAYLEWQSEVIEECVRVVGSRGSICWQVGHYVSRGEVFPLDTLMYHAFKSRGLRLRNRIVWHYEHGLHCRRRLSGRYETINWWTKTDDYVWHLDPIRVPSKEPGKRYHRGPNVGQISSNPLGKNPSDVWIIPNVKNSHPEKTIHPCQFPVELAERLVLALSKPGDIVLDPHMGVGSTVVAAIKNRRIGYGCDVSEKYVEVALERIRLFEAGMLALRPMGRPVYDPMLPSGGHRSRPSPAGRSLPLS